MSVFQRRVKIDPPTQVYHFRELLNKPVYDIAVVDEGILALGVEDGLYIIYLPVKRVDKIYDKPVQMVYYNHEYDYLLFESEAELCLYLSKDLKTYSKVIQLTDTGRIRHITDDKQRLYAHGYGTGNDARSVWGAPIDAPEAFTKVTTIPTTIAADHLHSIAASPSRPGEVWVTTGDVYFRVARSTDQGSTFSTASIHPNQHSTDPDWVGDATDCLLLYQSLIVNSSWHKMLFIIDFLKDAYEGYYFIKRGLYLPLGYGRGTIWHGTKLDEYTNNVIFLFSCVEKERLAHSLFFCSDDLMTFKLAMDDFALVNCFDLFKGMLYYPSYRGLVKVYETADLIRNAQMIPVTYPICNDSGLGTGFVGPGFSYPIPLGKYRKVEVLIQSAGATTVYVIASPGNLMPPIRKVLERIDFAGGGYERRTYDADCQALIINNTSDTVGIAAFVTLIP